MLDVVLLSLRVAALAVAASLVPGIAVGWLLARWRHPLRALLQGVVMLPARAAAGRDGLPPALAVRAEPPARRAWHELTGGHVAYTTAACVVAAAVVGFPLLVEAIRLSMLGVDPRLEQVSRSLGRGPFDTFLRVTLPLALPGLARRRRAVRSRGRSASSARRSCSPGNVAGETRTIPVAVYTLLNVRDGETAVVRLVAVSVALALAALLALVLALGAPAPAGGLRRLRIEIRVAPPLPAASRSTSRSRARARCSASSARRGAERRRCSTRSPGLLRRSRRRSRVGRRARSARRPGGVWVAPERAPRSRS